MLNNNPLQLSSGGSTAWIFRDFTCRHWLNGFFRRFDEAFYFLWTFMMKTRFESIRKYNERCHLGIEQFEQRTALAADLMPLTLGDQVAVGYF